MNLQKLNNQQQQALVDLAMLGMYADGHIAAAEDARIHQLLSSLGLGTDHDRNKEYDAAMARISVHSKNQPSARAHAITLAESFSSMEERQLAFKVVHEILSSDSRVASKESDFLAVLRAALKL
jgi:hypothetical protein